MADMARRCEVNCGQSGVCVLHTLKPYSRGGSIATLAEHLPSAGGQVWLIFKGIVPSQDTKHLALILTGLRPC